MRDFEQFQADPSRDVAEGDTTQEKRRQTDQNLNNQHFELKNAVLGSGQQLTERWADDPKQLAKSLFLAGSKSNVMVDTGTANIKELRSITGNGTNSMVLPSVAELMNGVLFLFKNTVTSTGDVFVNVYNTSTDKVISSASLAGNYAAGQFYLILYDHPTNSFTSVGIPNASQLGVGADLAATNAYINKDLNLLKAAGEYYVRSDSEALSIANHHPRVSQGSGSYSRYGLLKVWRESADIVYQIYHSSSNTMFIRYYSSAYIATNAGWTSWRELLSTDRTGTSVATNGYTQLPNGLILQFGQVNTSASGAIDVPYPMAWPNACIQLMGSDSGDVAASVGMSGTSLTHFNVRARDVRFIGAPFGSFGIRWMAIGY
jgi:hypothetical protein